MEIYEELGMLQVEPTDDDKRDSGNPAYLSIVYITNKDQDDDELWIELLKSLGFEII